MNVFRKRWFQVFCVGLILFFGVEWLLRSTGHAGFLPALIILGALVVPLSFVTFFYGEERLIDKNIHGGTPLKTAATCFFLGGLIGVIVAAVLEYGTLSHLNASGLFFVALIEEAAKLIFPVIIFIQARHRYRSESDGLLFGTASGMGFAALETMGYALIALIQSGGNIGTLEEVLLVRGLLSPAGHAAWTGLVCAALWYNREKGSRAFSASILGVYVLAVFLHFMWDVSSLTNSALIIFLAYIVIGAVSLILLIRRINQAKQSNIPLLPKT